MFVTPTPNIYDCSSGTVEIKYDRTEAILLQSHSHIEFQNISMLSFLHRL